MLVMSFVIAIIGYIGYRFLTRGERGGQARGPHHDRRQRRLTVRRLIFIPNGPGACPSMG